jgi:PAS domain-containing protein
LGEETPSALLIVPLKINEDIYGILEIAAFKNFEPYVMEFIERVAESIASTISSVKVNMRTTRLLDQSKSQSEELINQEEELRQTMEEMKATQEEMFEKQQDAERAHKEVSEAMSEMVEMQEQLKDEKAEMNAVLEAIDNVFIRVVYSTEMTMLDVNQYAIDFYGMPREELLGSKLSSKISAEDIPAFERNWKKVLAGETFKGEGVRKTGYGDRKVWYMYIPVKDADGNAHKVLMMGKLIE